MSELEKTNTATPVKTAAKLPSKDLLSRFRNQGEHDDDARMGFIDHLMELRKRLWISIIAIIICMVLSLVFYKQVYGFLVRPIHDINRKYDGPAGDEFRKLGVLMKGEPAIRISATSPLSTMLMVVWLGFWGGIVLASPFVMYEMWAFISPGLRDVEKRAIKPILFGGVFFFLTGAAIAYFLLAPVTIDFFVWLDLDLGNKVIYTSETFIELMLTMMIISGLLCEIPLIVAGLARLSILEPVLLVKYWKICIFGSIVLGTLVAPGNDIASMAAFSGLTLGIYFASVLMAYIFYKKPEVPKAKSS